MHSTGAMVCTPYEVEEDRRSTLIRHRDVTYAVGAASQASYDRAVLLVAAGGLAVVAMFVGSGGGCPWRHLGSPSERLAWPSWPLWSRTLSRSIHAAPVAGSIASSRRSARYERSIPPRGTDALLAPLKASKHYRFPSQRL
jgi:hypothetical protein